MNGTAMHHLSRKVTLITSKNVLRSVTRTVNSSGFLARKEEVYKAPAVVLQTNTPSIYTAEPLDPIMDLSMWTGKSRHLFGMPTKFITPGEFNYAFPVANVPEFAFVGRSNVGKSSLVSRLLGDDKLVRTSKLPGCTRSVNFFAFVKGKNSHVTYMVDLPGYGFAKAAKAEKGKWKEFVAGYLRDRSQNVLRRVYLLVDSRHGMKTSDIEMMKLLDECALPYQIILTKADASSAVERKHALETCFKELMDRKASSSMPFVHLLSAKSGEGMDHLQQSITEILSHNWIANDVKNPAF